MMRVGEAAIASLAEIAFGAGLTSKPLILFFNSFGLKRPVVNMLDSKRQFAVEVWRELNGTPNLDEAINQILSPHYWPDEKERQRRIDGLNRALSVDGLELIQDDFRIRIATAVDIRPKAKLSTVRAVKHVSYSLRRGLNPNAKGFGLPKIREMFRDLYQELSEQGYFSEYLGSYCVDAGDIPGKIRSPATDILVYCRKDNLWPIHSYVDQYSEDDLFDVIEYLFAGASKPLTGTMHSYGGCGMHWETFDKKGGERHFRDRINAVLDLYENRFELSEDGEILHRPEQGFEAIFEAQTPTKDTNVSTRVDSAVIRYRRHGATIDDRRLAVRDLADVLEYLRPQVKTFLTTKDESDLFNIANNFAIRHHNQKQKSNYDTALWLSWMFYLYLSTIHLVLRKIAQGSSGNQPS